MLRVLLAASLICLVLGATPEARAARETGTTRPGEALLDASAVPYLPSSGRAAYREFLVQATPRAFAISPDGAWGWAAGFDSPASADATALAACARRGGGACRVYARDLAVVWPGRESVAPRPAGTPLVAGPGWSLVPDERFLWRDAAAARGAYVWAHGRLAGGQDARGSQPQPHVRVFNNAGYDVLRFDRAPETDETDAAAAWMREALIAVRARGYARVVVGGQSRGGWNALQALSAPGLADAVVAIAPAAHGPAGSPAWAWALEDLARVVAAARSPGARVAIATFAGDVFDPDPEGRARLFRTLGPTQAGALLLLDRPRGLRGHGGGADPRFAERYGDCLLAFAEGRSAGCGGAARRRR
jgi:hypothetical protein